MSLEKKLLEDMKIAMKQKDKLRLSVIRYTRSAIQKFKVDNLLKKDLADEEVLKLLTSEAKKRRESIKSFRDASRIELAEKEEKELKILSEYLPVQLTPEKLRDLVKEKLRELDCSGKKDFGKAMKNIVPAFRSQADGNLIKEIVLNELGN